MLPHPDHLPSNRAELVIRISVSLYVSLDFCWPVPLIDLVIPHAVEGTSMPVAAIDKYGNLVRPKDHIGNPPQLRERSLMDSIPEPQCV